MRVQHNSTVGSGVKTIRSDDIEKINELLKLLKPYKLVLDIRYQHHTYFDDKQSYFAGIVSLIEKKYLLGGCFACVGVSYISLSIACYKKENKSNKIEVSDAVLKNMNIELRNLIAEGKKIKAIKNIE